MMSWLIDFKNVTLGYGKNIVLKNVNFQIEKDDFLGIVGPNGAGKTTFLRAVTGVIKPLCGAINFPAGLRIGYVPQLQTLDDIFPLTAREVADIGSRKKTPGKKLKEILNDVGLSGYFDTPYRNLSGGLKQRTLIAQSLVAEPDILLMDEPTNDLDLGSSKAIMDLLVKLHEEQKIAVIIVSHLINIVINSANKVAFLKQGTIKIGKKEEIIKTEKLREIYGIDVEIGEIAGKKIIVA